MTVTAHLYPGGDGNRILGMARGLDAQRVDHTVVSIQEPTDELIEAFGTLEPQLREAGVSVHSLGERHPSPGKRLPRARRIIYSAASLQRNVRRLARFIREHEIDVVDGHNGVGSLVGTLAARLANIPSVVTEYHVGPPGPFVMWPVLERLFLDLAMRVVTDSEERASDLRRWIYRRRGKISVIPNGIDPPASSHSRESARALFGFSDEDIVITQIARLVASKGQRVLIEAAAQVLREYPRARILITGFSREPEADFPNALRRQAAQLGIADRVTVTTYNGTIGDVWKATDIHAHPTLFDSLPNAIIEGMSLGKPAVVSAVGGIPTAVTDGETGLVVPQNDPDATAEALRRYLDDPGFASRMGEGARLRYLDRHQPRITAKQMENVFFECIS